MAANSQQCSQLCCNLFLQRPSAYYSDITAALHTNKNPWRMRGVCLFQLITINAITLGIYNFFHVFFFFVLFNKSLVSL